MLKVVVKIDVCGSKTFAALRESLDPSIRKDVLQTLRRVASSVFPQSEDPYPQGSFYKADGDALLYILDKPSVALRAAIAFMQTWFLEAMPSLPECRAFMDIGSLDECTVPGKIELTGKPFENISVFEKGVAPGRIYVTEQVVNAVDKTMSSFLEHAVVSPRTNERLRVFTVCFDDPRTVADSSLLHALFIAHPKGAEARNRLFEVFTIEFLLAHRKIAHLEELTKWAASKHYPLPPESELRSILDRSEMIGRDGDGNLVLATGARATIEDSQRLFAAERSACVDAVRKSILAATGREDSIADLDLATIIEAYLCAAFAELRFMANYFRSTAQLFGSSLETFARFDYVLRQSLTDVQLGLFAHWRRGFLEGLHKASGQGNGFIAAIFHNVLATYYLNRAAQASPYQLTRLKRRTIVLDTNVLYSFLVPSSQYHEIINYALTRLRSMGVPLQIFPITLEEYEEALTWVERRYPPTGPSVDLINRNPWLYQEYLRNPARYLGNIAVCRQEYSLAKGTALDDKSMEVIENRLREAGLSFAPMGVSLSQDEINQRWHVLRHDMARQFTAMNTTMDFLQKEYPDSVIRHDVLCLANMETLTPLKKWDELGPPALFVTVDGKLLRIRKDHSYIVGPQQFLEFLLPYLFLDNIPTTEPARFPNLLLSAQLGMLIVQRPPELAEIVKGFFRNPDLVDKDVTQVFPSLKGDEKAQVLNSERFRAMIRDTKDLPELEKDEIRKTVTKALEEVVAETRAAGLKHVHVREHELSLLGVKIDKLQKKLAYWRAQARRSK